MTSFATGRLAENAAALYLYQQGYEILGRNWRTPWCEIDIVAQKESCVYFVEVKFRASTTNGSGLDYITTKKLAQMTRAAESWVQKHQHNGDYNLAAISIDGSSNSLRKFIVIL